MSTPQQPTGSNQSNTRTPSSWHAAAAGGTPGAPAANNGGQASQNTQRNNSTPSNIPQGPQGGPQSGPQSGPQGGHQGGHHAYARRRAPNQYGNRSRGPQNGHHSNHANHNNHNSGNHHRMSSTDGQGFQRAHRSTGSDYYSNMGGAAGGTSGMPAFSAYPGQYVPLGPNLMPYQMMPMGPGVPSPGIPPSPGAVPAGVSGGIPAQMRGPPVMSPQAAHGSPHYGNPMMQPRPNQSRVPVRLTNAQGEVISLADIAHPNPQSPALEKVSVSPAASTPQIASSSSPAPFVPSPRNVPSASPSIRQSSPLVKKSEPATGVAKTLKDLIAERLRSEAASNPKDESKAESKDEPKEEPKAESKEEIKEPKEESKEELKEPKVELKEESKEPKEESKEPKAELKEESQESTESKEPEKPKEPEVEAKAEATKEPKVEFKEEPKEPKEPKDESVEESKAEEAKPEPEASKPEGETKQAKSTEVSPNSSPKLEPTEAKESEEDEAFVERLKAATRLAAAEVAALSYPAPITNAGANTKMYRYDVAFLRTFSTVVPPVNAADLRKRVEIDVGRGSRAMSQRGNRQGSHAGFGSMREGRMSRNASTTNMASRSGRNSRRGKDRGSNRHEHKDDKPPVPVEPLKRGENAWMPRFAQSKAEDTADENQLMSQEEVARKVKSLLNKMTLENFERISKQVYEIAEQSKHEEDGTTLRHVIELTLAKAVDEPHWSAMYAAFCLQSFTISEDIVDKTYTHTDEDGNVVPVRGPRLFRRYLLSRCQTEFEKGWSSAVPVGEDGQQAGVMSDEYYAAVKAKRHGLGIIRFIGELYKVGFLSPRIIVRCFQKLVNEEPTEDIVESMCKLVTTVAQRMEKDGSGGAIDNAMKRLADWKTTPGFPARLRFMIMDVEDCRKKGWKSKDDDKGPKTISQIHTDIAKQQRAAEEEKARSARGSRQGTLGRDRERDRERERERDQRREREREQRQARLAQQTKESIDREQSMSGRRQSAAPSEPAKPEPKINRFSALGDE